jgi:vacuolar-type H+-ATPase subunit I/STV1
MTTRHNLKRLQQLIWVFIYGGLLTMVLGLSVERNDESLGFVMALGGGGLALLGAVLIYVRSRLKAD